jgi:hypothetical protein
LDKSSSCVSNFYLDDLEIESINKKVGIEKRIKNREEKLEIQ